jgi:hypothetical protein
LNQRAPPGGVQHRIRDGRRTVIADPPGAAFGVFDGDADP